MKLWKHSWNWTLVLIGLHVITYTYHLFPSKANICNTYDTLQPQCQEIALWKPSCDFYTLYYVPFWKKAVFHWEELFSTSSILTKKLWVSFTDAISLIFHEVTWPNGTYGLPKAKSGCPQSEGITWSDGWRVQDMSHNKRSGSNISPDSHLDAVIFKDKRFLNRTFCVKSRFGTSKKEWPKGICNSSWYFL